MQPKDESPSAAERGGDEPALLARARGGDLAARDALCARYRDPLVRFCYRYLGDPEDAEDLAQDVLTKTLVAGRWPDQDALRTWLYRVARNLCLNRIRDGQRRSAPATLFPASQLADARTGPRTKAVKHELTGRAAAVLATLPRELAEVLTLRYLEGMGRSQIAEVVELSVSGVKKRLVAARLELARRLAERRD